MFSTKNLFKNRNKKETEFPDTKEEQTIPTPDLNNNENTISDKSQLKELDESKVNNVPTVNKVIINGEVIDKPAEGFSFVNKGNKINMDIIVSPKPKENDN